MPISKPVHYIWSLQSEIKVNLTVQHQSNESVSKAVLQFAAMDDCRWTTEQQRNRMDVKDWQKDQLTSESSCAVILVPGSGSWLRILSCDDSVVIPAASILSDAFLARKSLVW